VFVTSMYMYCCIMCCVGNEMSALKSVPAAIYSFLHCIRPVSDIPDKVTA